MSIEDIQREFPGVHATEARVYLDAVNLYDEAQANIVKNGAVAGHPKTGAPMVNPYLAIRESCARTMLNFHKRNQAQFVPAVENGGGGGEEIDLSGVAG